MILVSESLRETGLDAVGAVTWGTHFCQFYQTRQDLIDILVPYFAAGLRANEFCMWITAEPLSCEEAREALAREVPDLDRRIERGQIEIIPHTEWYLIDGVFESERVLNGWVEKLENALRRGYDGLRLTGNTFWLEKSDWDDFTNYEAAVDAVIGNYRILAMCTYSVDKCGASEVADVVSNHRFALIKRAGEWTVIESSDYSQTKETLRKALTELQDTNYQLRLSNARLQESESRYRRIADALQQALVPPEVPPTIHGYAFAAQYQPALTEAEVGGDFYDIFKLGDSKVGILIGDVAGKGLAAAVQVSAVRHAVRGYAYLDSRPSCVLTLANEALCREKQSAGGLMTAFFAVVDTHLGTLTYSSAGHEPPIVMNSDCEWQELWPGGLPLGIMPSLSWTEDSRELTPGDRLVFMTDGVTEARNQDAVFFGREGVLGCLFSSRNARVQDAAEDLIEAAKAHAGGHLQDDAAVVIIDAAQGVSL